MPVLAVVDDLLFRSKIEAVASQAGVPVVFTSAGRPMSEVSGAAYHAILIDLNASGGDPIATIQALRQAVPSAVLVGFCSHVETDLQARAREAGCSLVLPRSVFVQRLPQLLTGA